MFSILSAGEVAKGAHVSIRTVQYYDEVGLIMPCLKGVGGKRYYASNTVAAIICIRFLQMLGFQLQQLRGAKIDCVGMLKDYAEYIDFLINSLQAHNESGTSIAALHSKINAYKAYLAEKYSDACGI